ncbi:MAG: sulfite exporter TauE/SafE family protein [Methylohalobius sp. ZOD2]|nr:sulfite exporter TauE/SafE family protein [Methylothermaceae bacterium]
MASLKSFAFSLVVAASVWIGWYRLGGGAPLFTNLLELWQIALTMVFGSFIAGATSEGGGAVAFPVLTKVLSVSPVDARVFSLAIQSVGMSAASLVILAMKIRLEWRVIRWASAGGAGGIVMGCAWIAPQLPPAVTKIIFTVMVASFAFVLWALNRHFPARHQKLPVFGHKEKFILLTTGFLGGVMSGLVGNGIDIIVFSLIVLLFRVCEKVATPTSVVLMAINALVGFAFQLIFLGGLSQEVKAYWLAAIPVVVVGAPAGAMLCSILNRTIIVRVLLALIAVEAVSTLLLIPMNLPVIAGGSVSLAGFLALYVLMYRCQTYLPPHIRTSATAGHFRAGRAMLGAEE